MTSPSSVPASPASANRRPLMPRSRRWWFHALLPRTEDPAYGGRPLRGYEAERDALGEVRAVEPALPWGTRVSTDRVTDGSHLVVSATTRAGEDVHLLVCDRGWMPLVRTDSVGAGPVHAGGGGPVFDYDTDVPPRLRGLQLSVGDRQKVVAAVLARYLGAVDWDRLRSWQRQRSSSS